MADIIFTCGTQAVVYEFVRDYRVVCVACGSETKHPTVTSALAVAMRDCDKPCSRGERGADATRAAMSRESPDAPA